jgi:putative two-component system response regulator
MVRIAVIDDSRSVLEFFRFHVKELPDCEPVLFSDPMEALEWCRRETPDLVVVDFMMPGMNGLAFTASFRGIHGRDEVPLIMVTANADREIRYRALRGGANDFLTKPVDPAEFAARAANMLALRKSRKFLSDRALHLSYLVEEKTEEIRRREKELVYRLSRAAEFRDPETGSHIQRMAHFSLMIAANLGLPPSDQQLVLEAAPMHDIGKIAIPDQILLKPGKLTAGEFEIMKSHSRHGYELLRGSASLVIRTGADIALCHHEKFDGTGYPCGLAGERIPVFSRIVAVADVFDSLTSERPYKKAWPLEAAVDQLNRDRGTHFDPDCVDAFLKDMPRILEIRGIFQDEGTPQPRPG